MRYKTYKGRVTKLRIEYSLKALKQLEFLKSQGINFAPLFEDTLDVFKKNMRAEFKARQTPDTIPQRWTALSPKYAKWKFKHYGRRVANLILTGRLKRAVDGGAGWYQTVQPMRAEFGIVGIPYASVHQYGSIKKNIPERRYFLTEGNRLPSIVVNYLITRVEQEFQKAVA